MKLITTNYSQESATLLAKTSENENYPASNIKHQFRNKEWRSSGYFEIVSGKNVAYISLGDPATVAPTSGLSVDLTAQEVAQALMDEYGTVWTFKYNFSTRKFTVKNVFDTDFDIDNTPVDSVFKTFGFNEDSYTGESEYTGDEINHTYEEVVMDLGSAKDINSMVLLWGNSQFVLSEDAVVTIQANATNDFSSPSFSQIMTINEAKKMSSNYLETPISYRYWRIKFVDPYNTAGYVNLGVFVLGNSEAIDFPDNGFSWGLADTSEVSRTAYGQEYVDEYPVLETASYTFTNQTYDSCVLMSNIYKRVGIKKTIWIAMDNDGFPDKDQFCIYGKFDPTLSQVHVVYRTFSGSLVIRETN